MTREDRKKNPYYVRMMAGPVGHFGAYLMECCFDEGMDSALGTLEGKWKSDESMALTRRLASLSADQREAVVALVRDSLIAALHGLLHGLSHDEDRIRLLFDGHDVASESDGLQGDLFDWLRDLSRHPFDFGSSE